MSPDPFRRLDHIDPPDQWDAITDRVARTEDVDLDLDGPPPRVGHPSRRRAVAVAAAAAVVLLGGAVVADRATDDGAEEVAAVTSDPASGAGSGVSGEPCPFHLEPLPGVSLPRGTIATHDMSLGLDATRREGTVDGRRLEVTVGVAGEWTNGGHSVGSSATDGEQTAAWTTFTAALTPSRHAAGVEIPACTHAEVTIDAAPHVGEGSGHDTFDGEALAPIQARAEEILSAIRLDPRPPDAADPGDAGDAEAAPTTTALATAASDTTSPAPTAPSNVTAPETTAPPETTAATTAPEALAPVQPVAPGTPSDAPQAWEHTLPDMRVYRVETGGDRIKGFLDGRPIGDSSIADMGPTGGYGFEITPNPDGGAQDWVIVGTRPAGTTRSVVVGPDGESPSPTLTVSPDGAFWAIHGYDPSLSYLEQTPGAWPVTHLDADGEVIAVSFSDEG